MSNKHIRVVIIEPSPLILAGLRSIISQAPQLHISGELPDMNRIAEKMPVLRPDIVLINPALAEYHKRNVIRNMFPGIPVIALLYSYIDNDILHQFQGTIDLYDQPAQITQTLIRAVAGEGKEEPIQDGGDLSEREKEILVAVAKGMMNKEIASLYNISIHTVISHRKNISRKTGIKSVSGFVVYALLNNLIEQQDIQP